VLGPKLLFFFVLGDILGTGIYALTGSVAGKVGGALWLPFLLAFLVAFLTAFSYLELVGKYPQAAGAALYTQKAFGIQFLTFMVCFTVMSSGITSASSAARAFAGTYLNEFVTAPTWAVGIAFILLIAYVNFRGASESVKANVVLTCIELSGLLLIIGIGVYAVTQGRADFSRLGEVNTANTSAILAVTSATSLAFFAMVGFEDSVNMAEETHDPSRVFPKAMLLGMGAAATIYVLVAVASSSLVPADVLSGAGSGALFEVVKAGAPNFPSWVFAAIGLFAVANSALINMMMASRLLYGMSRQKVLPKFLSSVHAGRRTPWTAIAFTSAIAVVLVASLDVSRLGSTTSLLLLGVFCIVNVAVLVLRKDRVSHDHFRAPTWVPVLGIATCAYLVTPLSGRAGADYLLALVLLGVGVVLWGINRLVVGKVDFHAEAVKD
jgi:amino acid transporter